MIDRPRCLLLLLCGITLPAQDPARPPQPAPATPPPAARPDPPGEHAVRAMAAAERELRWLLQRVAALERALLQREVDHARELATLRQQLVAERTETERALATLHERVARIEREAARFERLQEENRSLRAQLERALAADERPAAPTAPAPGEDRTDQRAPPARRAPLSTARDAGQSEQAAEQGADEEARAQREPERRATPPRARDRGRRAGAERAESEPPPGARTPRRRGKIH